MLRILRRIERRLVTLNGFTAQERHTRAPMWDRHKVDYVDICEFIKSITSFS